MLKLLVVYLHLLATCAAVGLVIAADIKLLGKVWLRLQSRRRGGRLEPLRLAPPGEFVTRLVSVSLVVLLITGAMLVAMALDERPDALSNGKLLGKMLLVAVLGINAVVLHRLTFVRLARPEGLRMRGAADVGTLVWRIALPAAVSTGLWAYCAFLGIARPWNHAISLAETVGLGLAVVAALWAVLAGMLVVAASPVRSSVTPLPTVRPASPARAGSA